MSLKQCSGNKEAFNTLVKLEQSLTIERSLAEGELMIYQGKKVEIAREIIRVVEFFLKITGREMETFQIQILAGDLYEKFKSDTLEDVILMFKMARQGDFGKVYKLDCFEIMDWANRYLELKSEQREKLVKYKPIAPEQSPSEGKYFYELPQELQDKFNQLGSTATAFIPKKATEALDRERFLRNLANEGKKKKPIKFKKYL